MLALNPYLREKALFYLSTRDLYNLTDHETEIKFLEEELDKRALLKKVFKRIPYNMVIFKERNIRASSYFSMIKEIRDLGRFFITTEKYKISKISEISENDLEEKEIYLQIGKNFQRTISKFHTFILALAEKEDIQINDDNLINGQLKISTSCGTMIFHHPDKERGKLEDIRVGDYCRTLIRPVSSKGKLKWKCCQMLV